MTVIEDTVFQVPTTLTPSAIFGMINNHLQDAACYTLKNRPYTSYISPAVIEKLIMKASPKLDSSSNSYNQNYAVSVQNLHSRKTMSHPLIYLENGLIHSNQINRSITNLPGA
jgi:hypothetical protein